MNKKLAKITSANLNIKDRGVLTFWVFVDYEDGCSQGVGGLTLDSYNKDLKRREGTAYGCEMIRQLLLFFNVDNITDCKNQMVYVLGEGEGLSFNPKGFEHLRVLQDKRPEKIVFSEIYEQYGEDL